MLEPDESGRCVADVPPLPGCVTHGDIVDSALAMAREAIALSLRDEDRETLARASVPGDIIFATIAVPASAC